jgi:hypothetical protein
VKTAPRLPNQRRQPSLSPPPGRRTPTVLPPAHTTTIAAAAPVPPAGKRSSRAPRRPSVAPREPSLAGPSIVAITRALEAMPVRAKSRMLGLIPTLARLLAKTSAPRTVELIDAFDGLGDDDQELVAGLALRLKTT